MALTICGATRGHHKDDPIRLEADPNAAKSKWTYDHQEWKSKAWKEGNWEAILKARKRGGLSQLWSDKSNKKDSAK